MKSGSTSSKVFMADFFRQRLVLARARNKHIIMITIHRSEFTHNKTSAKISNMHAYIHTKQKNLVFFYTNALAQQ